MSWRVPWVDMIMNCPRRSWVSYELTCTMSWLDYELPKEELDELRLTCTMSWLDYELPKEELGKLWVDLYHELTWLWIAQGGVGWVTGWPVPWVDLIMNCPRTSWVSYELTCTMSWHDYELPKEELGELRVDLYHKLTWLWIAQGGVGWVTSWPVPNTSALLMPWLTCPMLCKNVYHWSQSSCSWDPFDHRKVAAGRFSVSHQMASMFLSDNTGLFTIFARGEDVSNSKWPIMILCIMYVNYMPILIFGSSFDIYK